MNRSLLRCSLAVSLLLFGFPLTRAAELSESELTVVSSTVHNGYEREKLPDGSFKPIRYSFGEGTRDAGSAADASLERLNFRQLVKVLSGPLAKQGFHPSRNPKEVDQLIVVHWGRTVGWDSSSYGDAYGRLNQTFAAANATFPKLSPRTDKTKPPQPENGMPAGAATRGNGGTPGAAAEMDQMMLMLQMQDDARAQANGRNSRLLGYHEELKNIPTYWGNMVADGRDQLIGELEDDRYYVILAAYDFRAATKERKPKILWVTRFSLQARGADFDRSIDRMVQAAASYFGRPTNGLHREGQREARAVPGKLEVIDYQEPTK
ncbi:MAG TPA: hypothetical protein VK477_12940 [Acidobacteriota bacterium]|nr:hypothetical protein [Acidobacteriota bacterium]